MKTALRSLCVALGFFLAQACDHDHHGSHGHAAELKPEKAFDGDRLAADLLADLTNNNPLVLEAMVPPLIAIRDFEKPSGLAVDTGELQAAIRAAFLRTNRLNFTALTNPGDGKEWLPPEYLLKGSLRAGDNGRVTLSLKLSTIRTAKLLWDRELLFEPGALDSDKLATRPEADSSVLATIARAMIDDMIRTMTDVGELAPGKPRPPLVLRDVKNDTGEVLDMKALDEALRGTLQRSGKFDFTREVTAAALAAPKFLVRGRLTAVKKEGADAAEVSYLFTLSLDDVKAEETAWTLEKEISAAALK